MNALQRGFLCALAAPALLLGACRARPDLARRIGLDVSALPEMNRQIEEGERDGVRWEEQSRVTNGRCEERWRIADEVAAGRMGLLPAAARYHELNRSDPVIERNLHYHLPGASDEELCCRQVIDWVESRLVDRSPAEAAGEKARLEEELREHFPRPDAR